MNPLRQDDPRHEKALKASSANLLFGAEQARAIVTAYFASLERQGVVLVEAYAGDDAGRT